MSAGRMVAPSKSRYRGYVDQFDGTIPAHTPAADSRDAAIVITRIGIRPGDHSDVLEALGLIPTVRRTVTPLLCPDCDWVSLAPTRPKLSLQAHRRARHKDVPA